MKRILVPVDGSTNSLQAVRHVVGEYFHDTDLEVHLLNVYMPFSQYVSRFVGRQTRARYHREAAERALEGARNLLRRHGVPHAIHVEAGNVVEVIDRVSRRLRVNQIVIGTARKSLLTRFVQDCAATRVLESARVPVQLVVGTSAPRWENIGIPALISAALAALVLAAAD